MFTTFFLVMSILYPENKVTQAMLRFWETRCEAHWNNILGNLRSMML